MIRHGLLIMLLDALTKLFRFDSSDDPQLDTDKLAKIKESWEIDIVSDDPLLPFKEKGVEIISEELLKRHGRTNGGAWRSTTKGRGK